MREQNQLLSNLIRAQTITAAAAAFAVAELVLLDAPSQFSSLDAGPNQRINRAVELANIAMNLLREQQDELAGRGT